VLEISGVGDMPRVSGMLFLFMRYYLGIECAVRDRENGK